MTCNRVVLSGSPSKDAFSFGSLNDALDELNTLNTKVTVPPKMELDADGQRVIGVRSTPSLNTFRQWRVSSPHRNRLDVRAVTKENMDASYNTGSGCAFEPERHIPKLLHARPHRVRTNPYYHRKPLFSLWHRSSCEPSGGSLSTRLNSCQITNGDYYLRSLRSVNSLPRLYETERKGIIRTEAIHYHPSSYLFEDELKRKTEDYCSYPLSVPVLTRSKSLEDLRESVKPKLKSLSTDMTSSSGCSFDATLSPRRINIGRNGCSGSPTTFPMLNPRRIFENGGHTPPNNRLTSRDVDSSMSLLIGKLDVS